MDFGKKKKARNPNLLICFDQKENLAVAFDQQRGVVHNVGRYSDLASLNEDAPTRPLTNNEAREKAKEWGFQEDRNPPFNSHGRPAFKKGQRWITPDRDGHNGGEWKEFLGKNRIGTLDKHGNKIKD